MPDLRGVAVMVLPVQSVRGAGTDVDAEIRYALRARERGARWLFPEEIQRALDRSPGLDVRLSALGLAPFLQAEVRRVGDPLFGHLRRLSALTHADLALLPVEIRLSGADSGSSRTAELVVALIDARDGRVRWFAVLAGASGGPEDFGVVASVAERLARIVAP